MNNKPPALKYRDDLGVWYTKWGGKQRHLGSDETEARKRFSTEMQDWAAWKAERASKWPVKRSRLTIQAVYERFIDSKIGERSSYTVAHLSGSLRRFMATYGTSSGSDIRPADVLAFKESLKRMGLADKTINHEIGAIKAMLKWGAEMELLPPIMLGAIKPIPLPPPRPKGYSAAVLNDMISKATADVRNWIMLQWATMARPAEMPRIVAREGDWENEFLFKPHQAKTKHRVICFSDWALSLLPSCEPRWSRLSSYQHAVSRETKHAPHPLRHGAASYLHERGVGRADIDLLLGHSLPRVSATYVPAGWPALRESAQFLKDAVAPKFRRVS